ncbi:unnamed protein product, partial [Amoebophrya sp. A120]
SCSGSSWCDLRDNRAFVPQQDAVHGVTRECDPPPSPHGVHQQDAVHGVTRESLRNLCSACDRQDKHYKDATKNGPNSPGAVHAHPPPPEQEKAS